MLRLQRGRVASEQAGPPLPRLFWAAGGLLLKVMPDSSVLVACLCAEWCNVCHDYRSRFELVGAGFPQARFVWIDVEDQAALVDPIEVENFPTLLIAIGNDVRFFGTITPQPGTLERLIRDRVADTVASAPSVAQPDAVALLLRLRGSIDVLR